MRMIHLPKKYLFIVLIGLAAAYLCRGADLSALPRDYAPVAAGLLSITRHTIHICLVLFWCISLHRRVLRSQVRRYLLAVGALLVFWLAVRCFKWEFVSDRQAPVGRYLWYGYYISMILIPVFGIFIADYIGRPESYRMPRNLSLLLIPAAVLLLFVFTNDLHQLVFRFPAGMALFDSTYTYGIFFLVIMAWFILLGICFVVVLLKKSQVPGSRKYQFLPAAVLFAAIVFWILYCLRLVRCDLTAVDCIIIVLLLESAIQTGLIPTNSRYQEIFHRCTAAAQIVDEHYIPQYVSGSASLLSTDTMLAAEAGPLEMGYTLLHSIPIRGGRVLWTDDIRSVCQTLDQLHQVRLQLQIKNRSLRQQLAMKEHRARIEEQNRLCDLLAEEMQQQFLQAEALLRQMDSEPKNARQLLLQLCIRSVYIKRRSNLILLSEEQDSLPAQELEHCLRESLENLELAHISTLMDFPCRAMLPYSVLICLYDCFQQIIEPLFPDMTAIWVQVIDRDPGVAMKLQIGCQTPVPSTLPEQIHFPFGRLEYSLQQEDAVIVLQPTGKEQVP